MEIPKLFELIFDSWLPASEYKLRDDIIVEVLHLWTRRELGQQNRYYEVCVQLHTASGNVSCGRFQADGVCHCALPPLRVMTRSA